MNIYSILSCILLMALCGFNKTYAQKHCDLELSYINPAPNSTLAYGDTLWLVCGIKNNGPDDMELSDTIYYAWNNRPIIRVTYGEIPAGSTLNDTIMFGTAEQYDDEIFDICHYFLQDEHRTFIDSVAANDSACITFVALGWGSVGIDAISQATTISALYPQPAQDFLNIQLRSGTEISHALVSDLMGRKVLDKQALQKDGDDRYRLRVTALTPGIYFLQLKTGIGQFHTAKICIQ